MRTQRTNKLYNFLVNNYGLSKEKVLEIFQNRVEELVSKHISSKLESNYFENLIVNRITQIIKDGFASKNYWVDNTAFEEFVKSCVDKKVREIIEKEHKIEVKLEKR